MSELHLEDRLLKVVEEKIDAMNKSFAAGYPGIQNAGRTGVPALAKDHIDPVIRAITLEDRDFLLTKDIPTVQAKSSVYSYIVKTSVGAGADLAGWESFLPREGQAQYMRVAEVLKVYGVRASITQMAELANEAGAYMADLEKENDLNAALQMAEALERDLYVGGDLFIGSDGEINSLIASEVNGPLRQMRGIQANVREGDRSQRGIPGDFIAYGNNRSVVFDRKGGVLERAFLDKVVTAVRDSRGVVSEAHCTTSQLAEFRATFFPLERADINSTYAINGAGITNDEQVRVPILTSGGTVYFIPTVFKYTRALPIPDFSSHENPPATPVVAAIASGATASNSGFLAGQKFSYVVQSKNIHGISSHSAPSAITIGAGDDNKPVELTITNVAKCEYYIVYRSPVEADGAAGKEMLIGYIIPSRGASTKFVDNGRLVPGLDSILFLPRDKNRVKLIVLGNLLNKIDLGLRGTAREYIYASYVGACVERPRSLALIDNVYQQREGL